LRWSDVRERTLLIEKAADGQGGIKPTKTGQSRTVRLLAPLASDLAEWRCPLDESGDDVLLFPSGSGGVWNDPAWQTWHRDAWVPACRAIGLEGARPYDLRRQLRLAFDPRRPQRGRGRATGRPLADDDPRCPRARLR